MNVASLELCRELYELSGWFDSSADYYWHVDYAPHLCNKVVWPEGALGVEIFPAYDLGYLLRKLPSTSISHLKNESSMAKWNGYDTKLPVAQIRNYRQEADIPEDAAARLAIELFKQGIIKKEMM